MSIWTVAKLDEAIEAYQDAIINLATAQKYTITTAGGSREVTRADLAAIRDTLKYLQNEKNALSNTNGIKFLAGRRIP